MKYRTKIVALSEDNTNAPYPITTLMVHIYAYLFIFEGKQILQMYITRVTNCK